MATIATCTKIGKEIRAKFDGIQKHRSDAIDEKSNMPETIMILAERNKIGTGKNADKEIEAVIEGTGFTSNKPSDRERQREIKLFCVPNVYRNREKIAATLDATRDEVEKSQQCKIDAARKKLCDAVRKDGKVTAARGRDAWTAKPKTWDECIGAAAKSVLRAIAPAARGLPTTKEGKEAAVKALVPVLAHALAQYAPNATSAPVVEPVVEPESEAPELPADIAAIVGAVVNHLRAS